jgi:L-alanine-DL-glutamate epimerase-like enolase superfamily enzyme
VSPIAIDSAPDPAIGPLTLTLNQEAWARRTPARITGYGWDVNEVLVVSLAVEGACGRAEALGVYYSGDTPAEMARQIEALRPQIETGLSRRALQDLLPPGGARNALDCALWDLEAKFTGIPAWTRVGLKAPRALTTTYTCHAGTPDEMVLAASRFAGARALKLKLTGEAIDRARVDAVRDAFPSVWLGVDANQGFTRRGLEALMPALVDARVGLIEQPFPIGQDALLDGFTSPIPIAADESVQGAAGLPKLVGRFDVANLKLDKCGGLTEALAMATWLRSNGLKVMVGCMGGTSLAMAPAFVLGQLCDLVDLDGPPMLQTDRSPPAHYRDGQIFCPPDLWGSP